MISLAFALMSGWHRRLYEIIFIKRNESANILKCISIFAVVFIHSAFIFHIAGDVAKTMSDVCHFCIPVFIFLLACFFEMSLKGSDSAGDIIKERLRRIIVPCVFWTIFYKCSSEVWTVIGQVLQLWKMSEML